MKKSIIKLMPIGGQAENGKSMYCLEIDDNWFIIDAGYRFPEVDKLGVDVIIPNFDYLKENKDNEIDFTFHSGATRKLLNELEQKKYDLVFCSKPPAEYRFTSVAVEFVLDKYKKHEN